LLLLLLFAGLVSPKTSDPMPESQKPVTTATTQAPKTMWQPSNSGNSTTTSSQPENDGDVHSGTPLYYSNDNFLFMALCRVVDEVSQASLYCEDCVNDLFPPLSYSLLFLHLTENLVSCSTTCAR
jgi:hypothetical protein